MKILYIGLFNQDQKTQSYETTNIFGAFQEVQSILVNGLDIKSWYADLDSDDEFMQLARHGDFDLVFSTISSWSHDAPHDGLNLFVQRDIPIVQWDSSPSDRFNQPKRPWILERARRKLATHFLYTHPPMASIYDYYDIKSRLMHFGCPLGLKPIDRGHKDIDVSFVGSCFKLPEAAIEELRSNGINVQTFGQGWQSGWVNNDRYNDIVSRSKISLNFTWGHVRPYHHRMNAKHFELMRMGACQLSTYHPFDLGCLDKVFTPDKNIVLAENISQLVDKVIFLLDNPQVRRMISNEAIVLSKSHMWTERLLKFIGEWKDWR